MSAFLHSQAIFHFLNCATIQSHLCNKLIHEGLRSLGVNKRWDEQTRGSLTTTIFIIFLCYREIIMPCIASYTCYLNLSSIWSNLNMKVIFYYWFVTPRKLMYVKNMKTNPYAKFRRRTSHELNRVLMRDNKGFFSLAFDSAHVKYGGLNLALVPLGVLVFIVTQSSLWMVLIADMDCSPL